MLKTAFVNICCFTAVTSISVANEIREWSGIDPAKYSIEQDIRTVTILAPGTFKFEALEGHDLGIIDQIQVASGVEGEVHLYVARDDAAGGGDGALHVKKVDLSGTDGGFVDELRVAGNLGELGDVVAKGISGPVVVGYYVLNDILLVKLGGDIQCTTLQNLIVSGPPDLPQPSPPQLRILSLWPYEHTIDINGTVGQIEIWGGLGEAGVIRVTEDVGTLLLMPGPTHGEIDIGRDLDDLTADSVDGSIHVGRDLTGSARMYAGVSEYSGTIVVERDLAGHLTFFDTDMAGSVLVGRDMSGYINAEQGLLTGTIVVEGDVSYIIRTGSLEDASADLSGGHVIVNGSLTESGYISTGPFLGNTEFIAIDYDGWDDGDTWESGAVIKVDDVEYTGNSPDARVWEITSCKADMNNDESVDFFDIDPFVTATTDPDHYALDYPGLAGSMIFHGNLNCDGYLDFFDIDPFMARITEPCCYEECGDCPEMFGGEGGGEWPSPLELAIELATHIAPERYDTLVDMIAHLAAAQKDAEKAAYWTAVWAALSE